MRILIAESDPELLSTMARFCEARDHVVSVATTRRKAAEMLAGRYDCILFDLSFAGKISERRLGKLQSKGEADKVIFLTQHHTVTPLIKLNWPVATYLVKPFFMEELDDQIRMVDSSRRRTLERHKFGNVQSNPEMDTINVSGVPLRLTRKESKLLLEMLVHGTAIMTKNAVAECLWGEVYAVKRDDLIVAHITHLKRKLAAAGADVDVKNVYGVGYRLRSKK